MDPAPDHDPKRLLPLAVALDLDLVRVERRLRELLSRMALDPALALETQPEPVLPYKMEPALARDLAVDRPLHLVVVARVGSRKLINCRYR